MKKKDLALGRINEFLKSRGFRTLSPNVVINDSPHPSPTTAVIPSSPILPCPFCPIVRATPWYLSDEIHNIVVCQDLNNRDYKLRILVVGSGSRWHEPWDSLSQVHRDLFVALAEAFAAYAITKGHARELVHINNIHSLFPGHAHIQACLI